jgi:hypothetical protein
MPETLPRIANKYCLGTNVIPINHFKNLTKYRFFESSKELWILTEKPFLLQEVQDHSEMPFCGVF